MTKRLNRIIEEYFFITLGSALTGFSVAGFFNPGKIASGGVSGISTIIYHTLGIDPGIMIFVLSVPLFIAGIFIFGRMYSIKSLIGTILLAGFTSLFMKILGPYGFLDYSDSLSVLLSAIFGGLTCGMGLGLVMKAGANTGGTDIIAQIIHKYTPISLGNCLIMVDGIVILLSAFVFGIANALYAVISVYITGIAIDKVVLSMGSNKSKTIYIISNKANEINQIILYEFDKGGTILKASGMYTKDDKEVIMTVFPNQHINELTKRVHETDKDAFMIVQETWRVLGEGFTPMGKITKLS